MLNKKLRQLCQLYSSQQLRLFVYYLSIYQYIYIFTYILLLYLSFYPSIYQTWQVVVSGQWQVGQGKSNSYLNAAYPVNSGVSMYILKGLMTNLILMDEYIHLRGTVLVTSLEFGIVSYEWRNKPFKLFINNLEFFSLSL